MTILKTVCVVAVMCSALFGIWRGTHKPHPIAQEVTAPKPPPENCVTMTIQGSFDGTNWFGITNINLVQVTNETHIPADILKAVHYVRMSQP